MENNETNGYNIYGMLLEIKDIFFLSIQYAQSLEEAINQAKLEFIRINPPRPGLDNSLMGLKVGLFTLKTVNNLIHENKTYDTKDLQKIVAKHREAENKEESIKKTVEIKKIQLSPLEIKNLIMKEIITKKDKQYFERHKALLTKNEIQYLTEKLENNKN